MKLLWLLLPLLLIIATALVVKYPGAGVYSVNSHLKEVEKRVKRHVIVRCNCYSDVEVYPLYDENGKFAYALVDLEPSAFFILKIHATPVLNISRATYLRDTYMSFKYEDISGGKTYEQSPYKSAGVTDQKMYFLLTEYKGNYGRIPAIIQNNKYLNLLTNEEFDLDYANNDVEYKSMQTFYVPKSTFYF